MTFTVEGAKRTGLESGSVRREGGRTVVPYESLIYDAEGKTYIYTSPVVSSRVMPSLRLLGADGLGGTNGRAPRRHGGRRSVCDRSGPRFDAGPAVQQVVLG